MTNAQEHLRQIRMSGIHGRGLHQWAASLTTEQLESKRQDIPFEVRKHAADEIRAIDTELELRRREQ